MFLNFMLMPVEFRTKMYPAITENSGRVDALIKRVESVEISVGKIEYKLKKMRAVK